MSEFLIELDAQIADLHAKQSEWIESNADATEPSPYFDLICAVEDMLAELRDTHAEHVDVLDKMRKNARAVAITRARQASPDYCQRCRRQHTGGPCKRLYPWWINHVS